MRPKWGDRVRYIPIREWGGGPFTAMRQIPHRIPTRASGQTFPHRPRGHSKPPGKDKRKQIEEAETSKEFRKITEAIDRPPDFDKRTPGAKVKLLTKANIDRPQLTRYLTLCAELNVLRAVKGSLPSVHSGVVLANLPDVMEARAHRPRIRRNYGVRLLTQERNSINTWHTYKRHQPY